jgi:hypothetical protein
MTPEFGHALVRRPDQPPTSSSMEPSVTSVTRSITSTRLHSLSCTGVHLSAFIHSSSIYLSIERGGQEARNPHHRSQRTAFSVFVVPLYNYVESHPDEP